MISRLLFAMLLAALAVGCTSHAPAALAVDTPLVPYQAPDIDELTGADLFDDADTEEPAVPEEAPMAPEAAPAPAAAPAITPAKAGH